MAKNSDENCSAILELVGGMAKWKAFRVAGFNIGIYTCVMDRYVELLSTEEDIMNGVKKTRVMKDHHLEEGKYNRINAFLKKKTKKGK